MGVKTLILFCAILFASVQVQSIKNTGRLLKCWPYKLYYDTFNVNFYHSSRRQSDRLIQKGAHFGPKDIDFDPRRRTAVISHGFVGYLHADQMKEIGNKLLEWQDMNVIIVKWESGAYNPLAYPVAVANTEYAAWQLKTLFTWFKNDWTAQGGTMESWGPIHFIGYSLGAHFVGQAAELLRVEENLLIDRITALDPAEPCFEVANPLRLSKSKAKFVDVIHTDGARHTNEAFGLLEPIGHADFYVNGGVSTQPGCERKKRSAELNAVTQYFLKQLTHLLSNGLCSHGRSVEVFINSIVNANSTDCRFWGRSWQLGTSEAETKEILKKSCDTRTCPQMGIKAQAFNYGSGNTNTFYVKTTKQAPYCKRR
ncbi:lipoprotein lipase-like [Nasonia vitripennis]|uniref:phospholipase A1 n=1 Tax=Nasonia vitripennis TaxID=7425 RepID=A0A7M7Q4A2_NASVI|nr:lipoprotein lipase-like [Nasonia vitripennis]XP_031780490.1 lipoprotein lipase-like [Nasonia vitripennis]